MMRCAICGKWIRMTELASHVKKEHKNRVPSHCRVCGGEGEHDWEVHNAELRGGG